MTLGSLASDARIATDLPHGEPAAGRQRGFIAARITSTMQSLRVREASG
jgi:hypothetical protein